MGPESQRKKIFDYSTDSDELIGEWETECFLLQCERQDEIDDVLCEWLEKE